MHQQTRRRLGLRAPGRLVDWLEKEAKPDILNLTKLLVAGFVPLLKREYAVPVVVTLQGDDVFLEELEEPFKSQVIVEMRALAKVIDGFVVNTRFYAEKMAGLFEVPMEKMHVVGLGSRLSDFEIFASNEGRRDAPPTIGYLARICPEKGFGLLVDAFVELKKLPGMEGARLAAAWPVRRSAPSGQGLTISARHSLMPLQRRPGK